MVAHRTPHETFEEWRKKLPHGRMATPGSVSEAVKYVFWYFFTPIHPYIRDFFLWIGVIRHKGRQNFLIGKVAAEKNIEHFIVHLLSKGFGNHFVAWVDDGELVSLRLSPSFKYQYHVRVFRDGEVRAHYELTPECHPFLHLWDYGMENRPDDFKEFFGDWVEMERV